MSYLVLYIAQKGGSRCHFKLTLSEGGAYHVGQLGSAEPTEFAGYVEQEAGGGVEFLPLKLKYISKTLFRSCR